MKKLILIPILLLLTDLAFAANNLSHDAIRKCYEDVIEQKSEDDLLVLSDIPNPEDFFNSCGKLDKNIIKEMYTELYNLQKMTTPLHDEEELNKFKNAMIEGAQALRIDFYPEDIDHLDKWLPFSDAIVAVSSEMRSRNSTSAEEEFSDNYLNRLYSIEKKLSDLNDADLAHYTFEYISMMTKNNCAKDCETVFNLFGKYYINRPKAKQILLEQTKSYPFLQTNISNGILTAEKNLKLSESIQNKSEIAVKQKSESFLPDYKIKSEIGFDDTKVICKKIKQIINQCDTSISILSMIGILDFDADEFRRENDKCQNVMTVKTTHSVKRLSKKKNDVLKSIDLVIQVSNQQTGYLFNESWKIKNLIELKNACRSK